LGAVKTINYDNYGNIIGIIKIISIE